ncbi:MAG: hypothetical protein AB1861_31820 [Cyanobacteriota bacterium]
MGASIGAHVEDCGQPLKNSALLRRCQPLQWNRILPVGGLLTAAIAFKV